MTRKHRKHRPDIPPKLPDVEIPNETANFNPEYLPVQQATSSRKLIIRSTSDETTYAEAMEQDDASLSTAHGRTAWDLLHSFLEKHGLDEMVLYVAMLIIALGFLYFDVSQSKLNDLDQILFSLKRIGIFEFIPIVIYILVKFFKKIKGT